MTRFHALLLTVAASVASTTAASTQIAAIGQQARALTERDFEEITRLADAGRGAPWFVSISSSYVVPPVWHVNAHLPPTVDEPGLRRGPVVNLEAVAHPNKLREWRVRTREWQYAQVPIDGRALRSDPTEDDQDRPFMVRGAFTDAELVAMVAFVRSSPPVLKSAEAPGAYGRLPIVGVDRVGPAQMVVGLKSRNSLPYTLSIDIAGNEWRALRLQMGGVP